MSITVTCPKCGKVTKAPEAAAGKKGKCPQCAEVLDIPSPPGASASSSDTTAVAELAKALAATAGTGQAAEAPASEAAPSKPPTAKPVRAKPAVGHTAETETDHVQQTPMPRNESDELIAVPPVGVQTPSGLPMRKRTGAAPVYEWQRSVATVARLVGFVVAGLSLLLGITTMLLLSAQKLLVLGLGVFLFTLILATLSVMWSLLARHGLMLLANLGEELRRQQEILDRISDQLD